DDLGLEPVRLERDRLSPLVLRRNAHPLAAVHVGEDARQREAALLLAHGAAALGDDGVDERASASLAVVHDDEAKRDADLRRREADADLLPHRLDHAVDDVLDLRGHGPYGLRHRAEDGIAIQSYVEDCHAVALSPVWLREKLHRIYLYFQHTAGT